MRVLVEELAVEARATQARSSASPTPMRLTTALDTPALSGATKEGRAPEYHTGRVTAL
jgi:hypothetical protein